VTLGSVEGERDQAECSFTPLLREIFALAPQVHAVAFVDVEGECVDYCSSLDAFDTKVFGAHLHMLMENTRRRMQGMATGHLRYLQIFAEERDFIIRPLTDEYVLIVIAAPGSADRILIDAMDRAAELLRQEAGLSRPRWEPAAGRLEVKLRDSVSWEFAPASVDDGERCLQIADVIGRWEEGGGAAGGKLVCFRVRSEDGDELTLVHDEARDIWFRW